MPYTYNGKREVKGDEPAEKHFWLLVNLVRSSGRAIDNRDIEQAIAEGCTTVSQVLDRFGVNERQKSRKNKRS